MSITFDANGNIDFQFLPEDLNRMINRGVEEIIYSENKREHQRHFNKTLNYIKNLTKEYDISTVNNQTLGFICYSVKGLTEEQQDNLFGDNGIIYTFPIQSQNQYEELNKCIDETAHDFNTEIDDDGYEILESDSEDELDEEGNSILNPDNHIHEHQRDMFDILFNEESLYDEEDTDIEMN